MEEEPIEAVDLCQWCIEDTPATEFVDWTFLPGEMFDGKILVTIIGVCRSHAEMILNTQMSLAVLATTVS